MTALRLKRRVHRSGKALGDEKGKGAGDEGADEYNKQALFHARMVDRSAGRVKRTF